MSIRSEFHRTFFAELAKKKGSAKRRAVIIYLDSLLSGKDEIDAGVLFEQIVIATTEPRKFKQAMKECLQILKATGENE